MSKDHNTVTCSHGKGLACPVCYDQTHNLSVCGEACNCMKCSEATIKHSEMTNPSKSSCTALRASEPTLPVIDQPMASSLEPEGLKGIPTRVGNSIEFQPLPGAVKFSELEDGAWFCPLSLWAHGLKRAFQKTLEDGGEHNAIYTSFTEIGFKFKDDDLVMRLNN